MNYEGNLQDLVQFGGQKLNQHFVIKFQGDAYSFSGKGSSQKILFSSINRARRILEDHIYCNFCQGHYWHKGKNNTFSTEKGWERNGGSVAKSEKRKGF